MPCAGEPADDAARQRLAVDRHRRLRAHVGERPEPGAETGRQHERARQAHALPSNTMSGPLSPSASRCCRNNAAVGIEDVVGVRAAERRGHVRDALLAAFDLDEDADRRLVDRDDDVLVRELLAVLLVAEPDVEPELLEHAQQHLAVADDGLELLAHLHDRRAGPAP